MSKIERLEKEKREDIRKEDEIAKKLASIIKDKPGTMNKNNKEVEEMYNRKFNENRDVHALTEHNDLREHNDMVTMIISMMDGKSNDLDIYENSTEWSAELRKAYDYLWKLFDNQWKE